MEEDWARQTVVLPAGRGPPVRGLWLAVELGAYVLAVPLRKHSFTLSVFVFLSPFPLRFQLQKGEDLVVKLSWPFFRSVEEQGAGQAWFPILCEEDTMWLWNGIKEWNNGLVLRGTCGTPLACWSCSGV